MEKIDYLDYIEKLTQNGYQLLVHKKVVKFNTRYNEERYFSLLYNEKYGTLLSADSYLSENTHIINSVNQNIAYISEDTNYYLSYTSMQARASFEYPHIVYVKTNDTSVDIFNQKIFKKLKAIKTIDNLYSNGLYLNKELIFTSYEDYDLVKNITKMGVENSDLKTKLLYKKSLEKLNKEYKDFVQQLPLEIQNYFVREKECIWEYLGVSRGRGARKVRDHGGSHMANHLGQVILEIERSLPQKIDLQEYRHIVNAFKVLLLCPNKKNIKAYLQERKIDTIVNERVKNSYLDLFFLNNMIKKKEVKKFVITSIDKEFLKEKFETIIDKKNEYDKTKIKINYFENFIVGEQCYTQGKNIYLKDIIKWHKDVVQEHLKNHPLTIDILQYVEEINKYGFMVENFIKHIELFEKYKINYYGESRERFLDSVLNHTLIPKYAKQQLLNIKIAHEKQNLNELLKTTNKLTKINKI